MPTPQDRPGPEGEHTPPPDPEQTPSPAEGIPAGSRSTGDNPLARSVVIPGRGVEAPTLSTDAELPPEDPQYLESKSKIYAGVVLLEYALAAFLLAALLALVVTQVLTRYVFSHPLTWSEELARFTFIWFTFAAASFVAARRKHITVLLYSGRRTGRAVSLIEGFAWLVVIAVSLALCWGAITLMGSASQLVSPGTGISLSVVYAAAAVGFGLIAVHGAFNMYLALRHPGQFLGTPDIEKAGI